MELVTVALATVRRDGGTQPRAEMNYETVVDYVEAYQAGDELPPPTVFYDGTAYWLADGFHRAAALARMQRRELEVDLRQGTRRDAILFAAGANAVHGLRRTNADKRRAVEMLLRDGEWRSQSNSWIAEVCAVSHPFVRRVRAELEEAQVVPVTTSRRGRDGKDYPATRGRQGVSQHGKPPGPSGLDGVSSGTTPEHAADAESGGGRADGPASAGPTMRPRGDGASEGPASPPSTRQTWKEILGLPAGPLTTVQVWNQFDRLRRVEGADVERLEWALARGLSQWYTRRAEADALVDLVPWRDFGRAVRVVEPSAGGGALVEAARRRCKRAHIVAHELDPRRKGALEIVADEVVIGDFLAATRPIVRFDLAIANTPYEGGLDGLFLEQLMSWADRIAALIRLNALSGQARCERVWSRVRAGEWQLRRLKLFETRPGFDGPTSGTHEGAKSDFVAVYLERAAQVGELREQRQLTAVEWG